MKIVTFTLEILTLNRQLRTRSHGVEIQFRPLLDLAKKFLRKRTIGEKPVSLQELTGNMKYKPAEMTLRDQWAEKGGDPYCGKVYPHATEILTMGLERLNRNPIEFSNNDPEYFNFIVNTLRRR